MEYVASPMIAIETECEILIISNFGDTVIGDNRFVITKHSFSDQILTSMPQLVITRPAKNRTVTEV